MGGGRKKFIYDSTRMLSCSLPSPSRDLLDCGQDVVSLARRKVKKRRLWYTFGMLVATRNLRVFAIGFDVFGKVFY